MKKQTTKDFEPNAFVIRTSDKNGKSHNEFVWPQKIGAIVEAPDWNEKPECGKGLHGLIDGCGDWGLLSPAHDAIWWIVGVLREECIVIDNDKVKFPRGKVVYSGGINGALQAITKEWRRIASESKDASTAGYYAHASTAGYSAHASTAGYYAHASTAGYSAHASTAGYYAHASTAGYSAHASTAGYSAHASTAGYYAHASTAGYSAHASTAGYSAHASTAGYSAHASTAGYSAHASTAGYSAHASTAGYSAHASTAGYYAHASTAGYSAHASTAGYSAHASTAGYSAHASTAGYSAHASTAGYSAHASTAGKQSISCGLGCDNLAKAAEGGAICLVCRDLYTGDILAIRASKVGENGIKPDTFYRLNASSEFEEVSE